jgi:DNA-binding response OmpR family regulator
MLRNDNEMFTPCILIIDYDNMMRHILRNFYELHGFYVLEAETDREAMSLINSKEIHLITLEIQTSGGVEFDLLRLLRRTSDIPIIIITTDSNDASKLYSLELGADEFIVKPVNYEELVARTKALLRRIPPQPN